MNRHRRNKPEQNNKNKWKQGNPGSSDGGARRRALIGRMGIDAGHSPAQQGGASKPRYQLPSVLPSVHRWRCAICPKSEPAPVPSGCGCEGAARRVHVACRARVADRLGGVKPWKQCRTCKQAYQGEMCIAMARERCTSLIRLPELHERRLEADQDLALALACTLATNGRHA